tara:strand:+ start:265 stop:450 length:186 start_codon:yes stop_codon:yes gene_type:complete
MSKVGEYYRELEEMGLIGGYEDYPESPEEKAARKAIKKAARKRNSRKRPYPFGFEYKKGEK